MQVGKRFILVLLLLFSKAVSAQKWHNDLELGIDQGVGYVLPEYRFFNLITQDYAYNYELSLLKKTSGKNSWEQLYNYPAYGLRVIHSSLGNNEVLGKVWGIYPYFQLSLLNLQKFQLNSQIGLGYSRVSRKYDAATNFLNVAIGSYGNAHFNARLIASYQITPRFKLKTALNLDHFSNANTAEPNLGINYLTWMSGLSYSIGKQSPRQKPGLPEKNAYLEQEIMLSFGGKRSRLLSSNYYRTHGFSYELRKQSFRALHLGLGADLFYDSSVKDRMEKEGKSYHSLDQFQSGIHLSQTLVYQKFSLTLQEGLYLGFREKVENHLFYTRGIARYKVKEHFAIRIAMKSHLHILDYPEIGLSWIL